LHRGAQHFCTDTTRPDEETGSGRGLNPNFPGGVPREKSENNLRGREWVGHVEHGSMRHGRAVNAAPQRRKAISISAQMLGTRLADLNCDFAQNFLLASHGACDVGYPLRKSRFEYPDRTGTAGKELPGCETGQCRDIVSH
jgi:hypothetical protein